MKKGTFAAFLAALLAAALLCGCTTPAGTGTTVSGTGNVVFNDLEGGFYGIVASDGTKYYPLNLPEDLRHNGLPVTFTGTVEKDVATTVQWGMPILLTSISATGTPIPTGPGSVSMEESQTIADNYVRNMPEYTNYSGKNLMLVENLTLKCPSCYQFSYTFDMVSMKDPDVIDRTTVEVTISEGKVNQVLIGEGLPAGLITVGEFLDNPIPGTRVNVTGRVSDLGIMNCPCFILTSGGASVEVWYSVMVTSAESENPNVDISAISNGDHVIVRGMVVPVEAAGAPLRLQASGIEKL
ncbi:putative small secreted protein [Methanolinea mesophila]|uniref:hypothetical protein n=1 Tax=Methanolinea mesophila TaxID=547055 RepID=UPI001AE8A674|nr:hypothetical protein [Methanolinea mesophila]MBP1929803.1 putative small secreted protein [Methanolinea mesophila]